MRIIHLGIGNFTRAHQAWYTEHAPDAAQWGIAAFTGRSAAVADQLRPQNGLYHLLVRDPDGDRTELIGSLSAVLPADDLAAWRTCFADPQVAIVTSTITEAGYLYGSDGHLRSDAPQLAADVQALRNDPASDVVTAPAKLVAGLLARRAAGSGPISFCPCDNVPGNGAMVETVVTETARQVDATLLDWMGDNVTFVTTMVDRITPRATDADVETVARLTGFADAAPVVTEPFTEWVLSGTFIAGRPGWDAVGAQFVDDIEPFETRKLRLLNGAHTLMAYAGPILGSETVREAITEPRLRDWVEQWWAEAKRSSPLPASELDAYTDALRARFENPQIRHLLAQIAADGSQKVAIRAVQVLTSERAAGRSGEAAARTIAAWVLHLRGHGAPISDAAADDLTPLVAGDLASSVINVLGWLGVHDEGAADVALQQAVVLEEAGGIR